MRSGTRNRIIVLEQRTVIEDEYGGEQETWQEFAREYAAVYFGSGSEQRQAAQQGGSQTASFEVLSNSTTRSISIIDHRIIFDSGIWNITSKADVGLNDGVRITAVRSAP